MDTDIFNYVAGETALYKTRQVPLGDNWEWNMYDHIQHAFLFSHSKRIKGSNETFEVPFNQVIRPILNFQYRTEGFNVVDVVPFVDNAENYHKSLLVKKFYPRYALEHKIDDAIDRSVESFVDYGLMLMKNVGEVAPEVVPLQRIAFCDQTDVLSGTICERHQYSIEQLRDMPKAGWDKDQIDLLIVKSREAKQSDTVEGRETQTPSKYIEVYEVHGTMPESWLKEGGDPNKQVKQVQIISLIKGSDKKKNEGVTLFREKETRDVYKALKRDDLYGRACGWGGVEELFDAQVWINYSELKIKQMLDNASLVLYQTTDEAFASRNNISDATDVTTGKILTAEVGGEISQVANNIGNITAFTNSVASWTETARQMGSMSDVAAGGQPKAGTPFALQALVSHEGNGLHEYRQDKIARFWEEIHREWIMESLVKEINKGQKFMEELSLDELESISSLVATNKTNEKIKDRMTLGKVTTPEERDMLKQITKESFKKGGNKRFMEIMKDEIKGIPTDVMINVAGKQRQLAQITDKLVNVFRQIIATPQMLEIKGMGDIFNQIIESSGLNPIDFSTYTQQVAQAQPVEQPKGGSTAPIKDLATKE